MRTGKRLLAVAAVLSCCSVAVWLSTASQGSQHTYEVRPQISIPEYKTDAARAIDAYERLMDRHMGLTEKNLLKVGTDIQGIADKLDALDGKLTLLSMRIARIEQALGIAAMPAVQTKPRPGQNQKQPQDEVSTPRSSGK